MLLLCQVVTRLNKVVTHKLLNCRTKTSWVGTAELSCQKAVDNLSTSWNKQVQTHLEYGIGASLQVCYKLLFFAGVSEI